jgi:hypothetical protein
MDSFLRDRILSVASFHYYSAIPLLMYVCPTYIVGNEL